MHRFFFAILILGTSLLISLPAFGDELPEQEGTEEVPEVTPEEAAELPPERRLFDDEHRREMYETSRLSPNRAVLYSLALPGLGNFYAEQYAMGAVSMMLLVFSGIFVSYGLVNNQMPSVRTGLVLGGITYVGSAATSYYGARQYNDRLRRNLHLDRAWEPPPMTDEHTWSISWTWQF